MDLFVGRSAELAEALDLLMSADEGRLLDVVGVRGIGKTTFLRRLIDRARTMDNVVVRSIDLMSEGIGTGHHKRGDDASANVHSDTYLQTAKLMLKATEGYERDFRPFRLKLLDPPPLPGLDAPVDTGNAISLGRRSQVGPITMTTAVHLSSDALREHVTRVQMRTDDEFVAAWTTFTLRRHVLVTIDSGELIADDEIGAWLLRVAPRLPRTLVVVTRLPMLHDFGRPSERLTVRQLDNLTEDEVRAYLAARLVGESVPGQIPAVVHAFTDGHPYGVALTAELIDQAGPSALEPFRLRRMLARVPDDTTRWGALIKTLLDQVSEPLLTRAVSAAAVVQRFDEPMLADLLATGDGEPADGDLDEAMRALRAYRLAQPVLSVSGQPTRWARLHEFVRQAVDNRLRIDHRREWLRLHKRAADYCFRWLQDWRDGDLGAYGGWYRYEDPEWQAYEREWLYHSGFVTPRREIARARFTLVFLEAFYWWGCYCPFPFNRHLVEDWERATATWSREQEAGVSGPTAEQRLADALIFLLDHYPPGGVKPATAPWDEMRAQLLLVRDLCGLASSRAVPNAEDAGQLERTEALLAVFLAHTRRFRDPADPIGDRYYERAQRAFTQLEDDWMVAWMLRERADHALERGDWRTAAPLWCSAAEAALRLAALDEEWDHELSADLNRIVADADWAAGMLPSAATGYGRAVAEAYWYQNRPHLPDDYTREFYAEMTGRATTRVLELAARDGIGPAAAFAADVVTQVPGSSPRPADPALVAAIRAGDQAALVTAMFPPGPGKGELRADDSDFLRQWRLRWEDDPQDSWGKLAELLAARRELGEG